MEELHRTYTEMSRKQCKDPRACRFECKESAGVIMVAKPLQRTGEDLQAHSITDSTEFTDVVRLLCWMSSYTQKSVFSVLEVHAASDVS